MWGGLLCMRSHMLFLAQFARADLCHCPAPRNLLVSPARHCACTTRATTRCTTGASWCSCCTNVSGARAPGECPEGHRGIPGVCNGHEAQETPHGQLCDGKCSAEHPLPPIQRGAMQVLTRKLNGAHLQRKARWPDGCAMKAERGLALRVCTRAPFEEGTLHLWTGGLVVHPLGWG